MHINSWPIFMQVGSMNKHHGVHNVHHMVVMLVIGITNLLD